MKKLIALLTVFTVFTQSSLIVFAEDEIPAEEPQETVQEEQIETEENQESAEIKTLKKVIGDLRIEKSLPEFVFDEELTCELEKSYSDIFSLKEKYDVYEFETEFFDYEKIYELLCDSELIEREESLMLGLSIVNKDEGKYDVCIVTSKKSDSEVINNDLVDGEEATQTNSINQEIDFANNDEEIVIEALNNNADTMIDEETEWNDSALLFAQYSITGFVISGNSVFYIDPKTNTYKKGQAYIDGYYYYFDDDTGIMVTGWKYILVQDKTVYYDGEGHMLYGKQTIDGKTYFFNKNSGARESYQKYIDGYYYFFDEETGEMVTGWKEIPWQNKTVYYDEEGHMLYGKQTIDGKTYFLNKKSGAREVGQKKIDGYYYYFDEMTGKMITGWMEIAKQNKTVYYDEEGHMLYGKQTIDGKTYFFNKNSGARESYQKYIDGYYYFFDEETGEMVTGWKEIPWQNKTVYYDEEGHMVYGKQVIDGKTYYFNKNSGALTLDGFETIIASNGQQIKVYYQDGEIVKKGFKLNQVYYQVDGITGAILHEQKQFSNSIYLQGIDISEHNGNIDLSQYQNGFVIIRIGWWTNPDTKAVRNMDLCDKYNIPYGVYLYDYTTDPVDAIKEAEFTLSMIRGRNVRCGVWFDMEDDGWRARNGVPPSHPNISKLCQAYCQKIEQAGYHVGIYASYSWFENYITGCDRWDKWVAHWGSNNGSWNNDLSGYAPMHQYTSTPLDKNVMYVDPSYFR